MTNINQMEDKLFNKLDKMEKTETEKLLDEIGSLAFERDASKKDRAYIGYLIRKIIDIKQKEIFKELDELIFEGECYHGSYQEIKKKFLGESK